MNPHHLYPFDKGCHDGGFSPRHWTILAFFTGTVSIKLSCMAIWGAPGRSGFRHFAHLILGAPLSNWLNELRLCRLHQQFLNLHELTKALNIVRNLQYNQKNIPCHLHYYDDNCPLKRKSCFTLLDKNLTQKFHFVYHDVVFPLHALCLYFSVTQNIDY